MASTAIRSDIAPSSQSHRQKSSKLNLWYERILAQTDAHLIIDVRTYVEFHSARIDPSLSMPLNQIGFRIREIPDNVELVITGKDEAQEERARAAFIDEGIDPTRIAILTGGLEGWLASGRELREVTEEIPPC